MKKRFYVLAALLVFTTGMVWAANHHGHMQKMDPASHAAKLKAELNLTDQQTDQLRAVFQDMQQKMEAAKSKGQGSAASWKEQHEKLMADEDARLKTILTPEQYTRYQQLKAQHMKEHMGRKQ